MNTDMKQCPFCKETIKNNATVCPHCGKRQVSKSHTLLGTLRAIVLVSLLCVCLVTSISTLGKSTAITTDDITIPVSSEDQLYTRIDDVLGKCNREDIERQLTELSYTQSEGSVFIRWEINDNFTEESIRRGARKDVIDILEVIANSQISYEEIHLFGYFSFIDQYGNVDEKMALGLNYSRTEIEKINWENKLLIVDNIYQFALSSPKFVHPGFQD